MFLKKLLLPFILVSLSGCATMFSGTIQDITFRVVDMETKELIEDAKIKIIRQDAGKRVWIIKSDDEVEIQKSAEKLKIVVNHPGYDLESIEVMPKGSSWILADIALLFPLLVPGLIAMAVDDSTKASWIYPDEITVELEKKDVSDKNKA